MQGQDFQKLTLMDLVPLFRDISGTVAFATLLSRDHAQAALLSHVLEIVSVAVSLERLSPLRDHMQSEGDHWSLSEFGPQESAAMSAGCQVRVQRRFDTTKMTDIFERFDFDGDSLEDMVHAALIASPPLYQYVQAQRIRSADQLDGAITDMEAKYAHIATQMRLALPPKSGYEEPIVN